MVRKSFLIAGLFTATLFAIPPANAQGAPKVRLAALPTTGAGAVSPSVSLSEPAYLFTVAIDNSGNIEVLSPASPSDAIRFEPAKSIRFPEFFTGFSTASNYGDYGRRYRRSAFASFGDVASTYGSVLVVASRTPFNFAAISDGVYWKEEAIRQIIRFKDPSQSVTALGRALTEKGQAFGHDYAYFGRSGYPQFASARFLNDNPCVLDYSYSPYGYRSFDSYYGVISPSYSAMMLAGNGMSGVRLVRIGTDGCGHPQYVLVPVQVLPPRDTVKIDSVEKKAFRSANAGVYEGEAARRVYEDLLRNRNSSDTYVGVGNSPVYAEKEDKALGRPVTREANPDQVETYARLREVARPINRTPVLREEPTNSAMINHVQPVNRAEPVTRSEPVMRSEPVVRAAPSAREYKVEVVSRVKDN